jgi:DNA-binding GntR family transcriptional regulator
MTYSTKVLMKTLVDQAYAALKEDILFFRLKPGTKLLESELAACFQVSRTPVREAIRQLAIEGLVTIIPQHGAVVSEIAMKTVLEAYHLRELLEPVACRMATERITDGELERLQMLVHQEFAEHPTHSQLVNELKTDDELHSTILTAAGSDLLQRTVEEARALTARIRFLSPRSRDIRVSEEHCRIVEAMRIRDPRMAEAAMLDHIKKTKSRLLR